MQNSKTPIKKVRFQFIILGNYGYTEIIWLRYIRHVYIIPVPEFKNDSIRFTQYWEDAKGVFQCVNKIAFHSCSRSRLKRNILYDDAWSGRITRRKIVSIHMQCLQQMTLDIQRNTEVSLSTLKQYSILRNISITWHCSVGIGTHCEFLSVFNKIRLYITLNKIRKSFWFLFVFRSLV